MSATSTSALELCTAGVLMSVLCVYDPVLQREVPAGVSTGEAGQGAGGGAEAESF